MTKYRIVKETGIVCARYKVEQLAAGAWVSIQIVRHEEDAKRFVADQERRDRNARRFGTY